MYRLVRHYTQRRPLALAGSSSISLRPPAHDAPRMRCSRLLLHRPKSCFAHSSPNTHVICILASTALMSMAAIVLETNASAENYSGGIKEVKVDVNSCKDTSTRCRLPWVTGTRGTSAECSIHQILSDHASQARNRIGNVLYPVKFDPSRSRYFEVKLTASDSRVNDLDNRREEPSSILHNTVVVLPDLVTPNECKMIVDDAERILAENKAKNIKGCKTESWTVYSRFNHGSQEIMDRVLGEDVLAFLDLRMPGVTKKLFGGSVQSRRFLPKSDDENSQPTAEDAMNFYWDDPVVIKYDAGNQLAPHEDMRDLTIVVPLNPLDQFPLKGGGTRFWLQGTSPDDADGSGGVSVKPEAGSGILFNGDITHSGNSVDTGTRFVLMTSITLDEDDDED